MVSTAFRAALHAYTVALQRHPWRTQAITTGALWACGDVLAQRLEGGRWSPRRTLLTAGYGAAFIGPVGHVWYLGLDRAARALFRPGSAAFVGGKVLADTAIFGPVHTAGFFALTVLGEGGSLADLRAKLASDFLPAFLAEVTVWPFVQALNFRMVPVEYQLLVVNSFTVLDSAFMSFAGNNDLRAMLADVPGLGPLLGGVAAGAVQQPKQQQKEKEQ